MVVGRILSDNNSSNDFVSKIIGLEFHQLEEYVIDMENRWDDVIQYHSFKCLDFP